MSKIELRFVQAFRDRHGKLRHYFRRPGFKRVALPGLPGSADFMAAYQAALSGDTAPPRQIGAERAKPGSVSALIAAYYGSGDFVALRETTRSTYRNTLERFRAEHGDKPVRDIQPHHLRAILNAKSATPGAANNLRKRLRQLLQFAVEMGWRDDNPALVVRRPRSKSEGFVPWSEGDIAAFEARWPAGSRERLALALLLYTGQRRSDVVSMGRQHVRNGRIHVRQLKTDTRVAIPVHPALKAEIDAAPPTQLTFVQTQVGQPFTAAGFTQWFREAAVAAGLSARTPHGLRKAAGRRLAEAGCSAKQIGAILGHRTLGEIERYTRDADQERLADAAMATLLRAGEVSEA